MPENKWHHDCALGMLRATGETEYLTVGLRNFLDDCEMYAQAAHGSIQSRQVVAIALATYRKFNSLTLPLEKQE
tara:strand:- start:1016 stop:1237 length:222 start_codon:yes stop_codon:yes gene_type:complete